MKLGTLAAGALLLCMACSCAAPEVEREDLKVLSWNVWHRGHSEKYAEKGCRGTLDILKQSGADVITMVETYGAANQVADALGYYHRLLSDNLSIYSCYPIVKTYLFPEKISTFNFGGVMIDVDGRKVRVFDTWLHYLPDATDVPVDLSEREIVEWEMSGTRDEEVKKMLETLRPYLMQADSIPVIMAGDFNTHSHLDWTDAVREMYGHGGKTVAWPVSIEMQKAGFVDSFREMNPDVAKNIGTTWRYGQGADKRNDRIDYIYYTGRGLEAVASESHNGLLGRPYTFCGREFFYASDHGFVLTTFKLK